MKRTPIRCGLAMAACGCLLVGCDKVAKLAVKETLENVGAAAIDGSSGEEIREMFAQANAACPRKMDQFTTLESITMVDDRHVEYRYKVNQEGRTLARKFDKQVLQQAAIKMMQGNAMAVAIAQRDLSIEHIYEDVFGGHLFSYTINKAILTGEPGPLGAERDNPFETQAVKATPSQQVLADHAVTRSAAVAEKGDTNLPSGDQTGSDEEPDAEEPQAELPKAFKPERSPDNPAGVRANPFFDA